MTKRKPLAGAFLLLLALFLGAPATGRGEEAEQARADMAKGVGERAPAFSVATSEGKLADYDRDYYGRHHLVLTFFPAAFTPV